MSRKHQLAVGQKRDSTPSGLLRARKLEVDKFNANERFYAGAPSISQANRENEVRRLDRLYSREDRQEPRAEPGRMNFAEEERRNRAGRNIIAKRTLRVRLSPRKRSPYSKWLTHAWQRKKAFRAEMTKLQYARAPQP